MPGTVPVDRKRNERKSIDITDIMTLGRCEYRYMNSHA